MNEADDELLAAARGHRRESDAFDPEFQADLLATERAGHAARTARDVALEIPPPSLWNAIASDAFGDVPTVDEPVSHPLGVPVDLDIVRARRQVRVAWIVTAAALLTAVVALAFSAIDSSPTDQVVQAFDLKALQQTGSGSAHLVRHNGQVELRIDATVAQHKGQFYEVWLLNRSVTGMVALGPLNSGHSYPLPHGLKLDDFPIVDVSIQDNNGNPAHSGHSILRADMGTTNLVV